MSDETTSDFHVANFRRIADALCGCVDEVVISFLHLYRKTRNNMDAIATDTGNRWWDPPIEHKRELAQLLYLDAAQRGITLTICSRRNWFRSSHCHAVSTSSG